MITLTMTLSLMSRRSLALQAVNELSQERFRYGKMDCCLFAIEVALLVTGNDHGHRFRNRYATRAEAGQLIDRAGGLQSLVSTQLGEPVDTYQCLDGDPVMVAYDVKFFDHTLGVRLGEHIVMKTSKSVRRINLEHGILGWRA